VNGVLLRLSLAAGAVLGLVAFVLGMLGGVSAGVAMYRALVVLLGTTVVVAFFFRRFTMVLYRFVAERMAEGSGMGTDTESEQATLGSPADRPDET